MAGSGAPPSQHLNIACGDQFTVHAGARLVIFLCERHGLGGELPEPEQIRVVQPFEINASFHGVHSTHPNKRERDEGQTITGLHREGIFSVKSTV